MSVNVFPKVDVVFCYVCTRAVAVQRFEGDLESYRQARSQECFDAFISKKHLDIHPFLCARQECRAAYNQLPEPLYREEHVPFLTDVVFDEGSFFDFPTRNNRPEIVSESARLPISPNYFFHNGRGLEPLSKLGSSSASCTRSLARSTTSTTCVKTSMEPLL